MRSYEHSLQRLGLDRIDILLVHDLGEMTHGCQADSHFKIFVESGYRALDELRSTNDVSAIGLGVNETAICEEAMKYVDLDCILLAGRYSLLEQESAMHFLPACHKRNINIILGGVFNSGILATGVRNHKTPYYNYRPAPGRIIKRVAQLEGLCEAHSVSLPAAAIQFPLANPAVSTIIPGLSSPEWVEQTLAMQSETIPEAFWRDLRDSGLVNSDSLCPDEVSKI